MPKIRQGQSVTRDEDIIKLAYAMAVGPQRFGELLEALGSRLEDTLDAANTLSGEDLISAELMRPSFAPLETHFENALSLMQAGGRRQNTAHASIKVIESDDRPSALVTQTGKVICANTAAQDVLGLHKDMTLSDDLFERGHLKSLMTNLAALDRFEENKIISILGMINPDSDETVKIALTKAYGTQNEIFGHISAINISWFPHIARQFQTLFKLTPVELEITRAVVTGVALVDLAKQRKRAVGTVRLQAKKLLTKLNLRSQTELACLYSGFSKFNLTTIIDGDSSVDTRHQVEQGLLIRSESRVLDYEIAGPADGRPVLFLPALIGGTAITPQVNQALLDQNVRLIMAWRPGLSQSGPDGAPDMASFARYASDIEALLDELKIPSCPVIGHITSAMFAYGAAKYLPGRISKLVCVNAIVPTHKGPHMALLEKNERLRILLVRHTPKIGRMVIHAMLSKVDAGYDEEFLTVFLDNQLDYQTLQDQAIRRTFREAFSRTTLQGYECFVHELSQAALNWGPLTDDLHCPVTLLVGEHNPVYTPDLVRAYARQKPGVDVHHVPETAHLLFYQAPASILQATL